MADVSFLLQSVVESRYILFLQFKQPMFHSHDPALKNSLTAVFVLSAEF